MPTNLEIDAEINSIILHIYILDSAQQQRPSIAEE